MLTENDITQLLVDYLKGQNYTGIKPLTTTQKGIDVTAIDPEENIIYIEVKGETSAKETSRRFGLPFNGNQMWTHVSVALLKTITLMNDPGYKDGKFGMAFPLNHKDLLLKIVHATKKLGIVIFLVSAEGVEVLS